MHLHIVGTKRNKLNVKATIGFYVWDSETNQIEYMTVKDIREAVCNDGVCFSNAELSENSMYGKVVGSSYNMDKLTYTLDEEKFESLGDFTVLEEFPDRSFLIFRFDGTNIESHICNLDEINSIQDNVWNYNSNGFGLYRKVNTSPTKVVQSIKSDLFEDKQDLIKEAASRREALLEQAYDPSVIWSIGDFKEFMGLNNWRYELETVGSRNEHMRYKLNAVDKHCQVLHMPIGVKCSDYLFEDNPDDLDTIIICPEYTQMLSLYPIRYNGHTHCNGDIASVQCRITYKQDNDRFNKLDSDLMTEMRSIQVEKTNIQNIYVQALPLGMDDWNVMNDEIDLNGLCFLNIYGVIDLDIENKTIRNGFNISNINSIPKLECKAVRDCFNDIILGSDTIEINLDTLFESFIRVNTKGAIKVIVGEDTKAMCESFKYMRISQVDLSQAKRVTHVTQSFFEVKDLETFDLSGVAVAFSRFGPNNLCGCPNLKTVILPQNGIDTVCQANIERSPLVEEVVIPNNTNIIQGRSFVNGHCRVIYPTDMQNLNGNNLRFYSHARDFEPIFPDGLTEITTVLGNVRGTHADLKLPSSIAKIPQRCFKHSALKDFDSGLWPDLHIIPKEAFYGSSIEIAVFRDNITRIADDALMECNNLETVILGANIEEMSYNPFKGRITDKLLKIYVVKGSYAQKRLRKNNRFTVIEVGSTEEACKIELENVTPENKQYKFDLILNDTEYESLLHEDCRGNIGYLYPLFKALKNDESYLQQDVVLNTSKYMEMPLNSIQSIYSEVKNARDTYMIVEGKEVCKDGTDKQLRRFNVLSNFITSISNNCKECFTEYFTHSCNQDYIINLIHGFIYLSRDASISLYKIKFGNAQTIILVTEYKGSIVYITPFWSAEYYKLFTSNNKLSFLETHRAKYHNIALGTVFLPGDDISPTWKSDPEARLHGYKIPHDMLQIVNTNMLDTCVLLGVLDYEKKSKRDNQENVVYDILLLEKLNGKLIECTTNMSLNDTDNIRIQDLNIKSIRQVLDMQDIGNVNPEYLKVLLKGFNDKGLLNNLLRLTISRDAEKEFRDDLSNYDISGDLNLIYIGELIYQNNITTVDELIGNRTLLKRVLDSHLYDNANISMNYIKKHDNIYNSRLMKPLGSNGEILLEFEATTKEGQRLYIIGIANGSTTMSSKKFLMGGLTSLQSAIQLLYNIGHNRAEGLETDLGITDEPIDISKYYTVTTFTPNSFRSTGLKLHLGIDLYNGDSYIIADIWDMSFYKLFRTKTYKQAISLFNLLTIGKVDSIKQNVYGILNYIQGHLVNYNGNELGKLRDEILKGLPNGVPYTGAYPEIANILARQPLKNRD